MRVLLVGANSTVGKALMPMLSTFSAVITSGRTSGDIPIDLGQPSVEIVLPNDLDTVVLAASAFGGKTGDEIIETENVNVLGTLKLCDAAVKAGVKHFVFVSSMFVTLPETSPHYSVYAVSKKHAEDILRLFCSIHSLPLTIIRPSQLYGAGKGFEKHQPFFYHLIAQAQKGEDILFYGKHNPLRNYLYINDLATIVSKIVSQKPQGTFACTHPQNVSYEQIARAAYTAFNTTGVIRYQEDKPDIPDNVFEYDDSLYRKINFYPEHNIGQGINEIALSKE